MELNELIGRPERWARLFGLTTLIGLLCGLIGPYGSYIANGASRICFWLLLFWSGTLILWPSLASALWFSHRKGLPPIFTSIGFALLGCVPLAIIAAGACYLFWPVHASGLRPQEWYTLTVVLALPVAGLALWLELYRSQASRRPQPAYADVIMHEARSSPEANGLPAYLLDLITCLQMEDHHIRYFTPAGSRLHLGSMRDAVDQLGSERGMQVHRSWWVARSSVCQFIGDSRSLHLILTNGMKVPVARNRIASVRAAGWLQDDFGRDDKQSPRQGAAS